MMPLRVLAAVGWVALLSLAPACGTAVTPTLEEVATMKPSDTPYRIQARVWRDEQPGEDPLIHVSVRFDPREDAAAWPDVDLAALRLEVGPTRWSPRHSALDLLDQGAFEVRAEGEPTLEAGSAAAVRLKLATGQGAKEIEIPAVKIELIE